MSPYREPAVTVPDKPKERYWRPQVWALIALLIISSILCAISVFIGHMWWFLLWEGFLFLGKCLIILATAAVLLFCIWLFICFIVWFFVDADIPDLMLLKKVKFGSKPKKEDNYTSDSGAR